MKHKTRMFMAAFCVVFLSGLFTATIVYGQYGLEETAGAAGLKQYGSDIPTIVGNIAGTALSMISVLFFGLMIYGGIRWMLARGKEEEAKKALDTIIAAIIGIIIVLAAYAITNFVFKSVSGTATPAGTGPPPGNPVPVTSWCYLESTSICQQISSGQVCNGQSFESNQDCSVYKLEQDSNNWCYSFEKNDCSAATDYPKNECPGVGYLTTNSQDKCKKLIK